MDVQAVHVVRTILAPVADPPAGQTTATSRSPDSTTVVRPSASSMSMWTDVDV